MEEWHNEEAVQFIVRYVNWRRKREGIVPVRGRKLELSCEAFGEFWTLLNVQLLTTPEFQDGWLELRLNDSCADAAIVGGLLHQIERDVAAITVHKKERSLQTLLRQSRDLTAAYACR